MRQTSPLNLKQANHIKHKHSEVVFFAIHFENYGMDQTRVLFIHVLGAGYDL